jgi:hypothetical protein
VSEKLDDLMFKAFLTFAILAIVTLIPCLCLGAAGYVYFMLIPVLLYAAGSLLLLVRIWV